MSGATAGYSGGGATAYPAQEAGQDLGGEHLSDLTGDTTGKKQGGGGEATPGSAGYDGGGASAYPAEQSGKSLGGEHMSDLSGDSKADLPDLGQAPGAELGMAPETTE